MKKTGIFYGSSTGTTEEIAYKIAKGLGVDDADVHNVAAAAPSALGDYDILVMGSSTWGDGELQDDWYDFIAGAESLDLKGKTIALFGCGDESMSDTFCNAVGELYRRLTPTGAAFVDGIDTDGYHYNKTGAEIDGKYVGLLLDEVNHPELTDERLSRWIKLIK